MAYTTTDLEALERALAQGLSKVKFQDGREVTYRSVDELRAALREVQRSLSGKSPIRRTRVQYEDGL